MSQIEISISVRITSTSLSERPGETNLARSCTTISGDSLHHARVVEEGIHAAASGILADVVSCYGDIRSTRRGERAVPVADDSDVIWIRATAESRRPGVAPVTEYTSVPRADWEAANPLLRQELLEERAAIAAESLCSWGASVVDASEVPR